MTITPSKEDIWAKMDQQFDKTIVHAENAYRTNYYINLVIVGIGIVFLISSLIFAYTRGLNVSTLTFAGLGIADFVALFLVSPQRHIQQLIGDLSQITIIYRTWKAELNLTENYEWDLSVNPPTAKTLDFDQITKLNTELDRIAEWQLSAIEKYIGTDPDKTSSQTNTQKSKS